ncbi:transmembrane protein 145-like isoform X2 [Tigriopus californicus]|uniref:transmembrane protein 145-like isoform X2 n=1 Tax=Tigriopus californicus TaxID=6832 RepID=UPI0027DA4ADC|nr:transmembrane protein 145-like isoform X2 [Tigriopus californicus]|eukprot:TCALIF_02304-PA protein Name:"Similar to tmem145 Transmembrane protein 145 (Xenopus laevis)" AED:0.10 eAED:0.10 QI:0/0.8/0.33/1/0.6/0.5/6/212/602
MCLPERHDQVVKWSGWIVVLNGIGSDILSNMALKCLQVYLWSLALLWIHFPCLELKVLQGFLRTGENWSFLSRFCFLSLHGRFQYEISYDEDYAVQNIDLYYDTPTQWARVYGDESRLKTCAEKESVLQVENNQFINLTTDMLVAGCKRHVANVSGAVPHIICKGTRNFNTARERWWFVAISNCNSTNGLSMNYRFLMTNGYKGDLLHYHFSADEFYILPILCVAFFEHFFLLLLSVWSAMILKGRQLLHATYKLYLLSLFLHILGIFLLTTHYLVYALDGVGLDRAQLNGRMLEATSEIIFMTLLILIAKGYTVTRARLRQASSIKVAIFVSCYCITYTILFIFEQKYFDPGQVLYVYESLGGYGLVILRTMGWCMFIYSTFFTLKHYPEKGGFYYPFFSFYTLWFIAGPCIIIISNHIIAEWVRQKVVVSVEHFVVFLGHTVFLILTRPNAHNANFPFHVRTTQIGILEAMAANPNTASNTLGPHTLDNFSHGGSYGVTSPATATDIFTVDSVSARRTIQRNSTSNGRAPPPPYSVTSGGDSPKWSIRAPVVERRLSSNGNVPSNHAEENESNIHQPNGLATIFDPNAGEDLEEWKRDQI